MGCAACESAGFLRLLYNLSVCVCLSCSCACAWGGQTLVPWHSQGLACAGWPGDVRWEPHPLMLPFIGVFWHVFVHGYAEEDVTPLCRVVLGCLRTSQYFSDFGFSYACVRLHLILCFAGCGLVSLFPCRILPCLCGRAPFLQVWHSCVGVLDRLVLLLWRAKRWLLFSPGTIFAPFSMSLDFSSCFVRCSASFGAEHGSTSVKSSFSSYWFYLCFGICVLLACDVLCLRWLRSLCSLSSP